MVVVSLCDRTGNIVKPWADMGFDCYCVDIQHPIRKPRRVGNIVYQWGDVRTWIPPADIRGRIGILFAFPPCTHVARSGGQYFRIKGSALLRDSLEIFTACEHAAQWAGVPYMIENPVGSFSTHIRPPDCKFQPWEYGDNYTKQTHLWTGNGFVMPRPIVTVEPVEVLEAILSMPDSKGRQDRRSETPPGFSKAVCLANSHLLRRAA